MPSGDLVVIDTSVWIDYLSKKTSTLEQTVDALLENARVACAGIILAELVQGAKSQQEVSRLRAFFNPLHWIVSTDEHWSLAGELSFKLKRSGKTVNLTDCYIATLAQGISAEILTLDKDFKWIAETGGCSLFPPP